LQEENLENKKLHREVIKSIRSPFLVKDYVKLGEEKDLDPIEDSAKNFWMVTKNSFFKKEKIKEETYKLKDVHIKLLAKYFS